MHSVAVALIQPQCTKVQTNESSGEREKEGSVRLLWLHFLSAILPTPTKLMSQRFHDGWNYFLRWMGSIHLFTECQIRHDGQWGIHPITPTQPDSKGHGLILFHQVSDYDFSVSFKKLLFDSFLKLNKTNPFLSYMGSESLWKIWHAFPTVGGSKGRSDRPIGTACMFYFVPLVLPNV